MKTLTACLAVGVALTVATPAGATLRSDPEQTARASAFAIRFVTPSLIARTLTNAKRIHLPEWKYRRLAYDMRELKRRYNVLTWRQKAKDYCLAVQAAFGYPHRYFYNGRYFVPYPYDACKEYYG